MPPRKRPPARRAKARAGSAEINAGDLRALRHAWRTRELVLFLEAGVSIPYGLPSWKNLVLELLFDQAQNTRRLGGMWSHYRRAVASWMTDYFSYDPLVLARMVERDLRAAGKTDQFLERLREHMYAHYQAPKGPTILDGVCKLIARTGARHGSIPWSRSTSTTSSKRNWRPAKSASGW